MSRRLVLAIFSLKITIWHLIDHFIGLTDWNFQTPIVMTGPQPTVEYGQISHCVLPPAMLVFLKAFLDFAAAIVLVCFRSRMKFFDIWIQVRPFVGYQSKFYQIHVENRNRKSLALDWRTSGIIPYFIILFREFCSNQEFLTWNFGMISRITNLFLRFKSKHLNKWHYVHGRIINFNTCL